MNILLIGSIANLEEAKLKFGHTHTYSLIQDHTKALSMFPGYDVVFDFVMEDEPMQMTVYQLPVKPVVFINTTITSLRTLAGGNLPLQNRLFGFCGMPTLLNRTELEVSLYRNEDRHHLTEVCGALGTSFQIVEDQVGLVTPRVIAMIINEAYCTAQEGIATKEDIDLAMTLGTNYPQGPFAWGKIIGIKNIYRLLKALYESTGDNRYRSCELLNREAAH